MTLEPLNADVRAAGPGNAPTLSFTHGPLSWAAQLAGQLDIGELLHLFTLMAKPASPSSAATDRQPTSGIGRSTGLDIAWTLEAPCGEGLAVVHDDDAMNPVPLPDFA